MTFRDTHPFRFDPPSAVLPADEGTEPARSRVVPAIRAAWHRISAFSRWVDDSLVGDLIGVACIFIILVTGLFMGVIYQ
ncbi:hypothetical protein [Chachezhania sediminis]|uniref:hypothetical protein n=1 Tax=Chachezhania sediminis TaxID=2599291 RepID=UPI00131BF42F|nr:hypothetical protein [Chachezhania sediminis]